MKWVKGEYSVTDDQKEMDISIIHGFLTSSYWAQGIDKETVERSMANSICLGLFRKGTQIGFGRVTTDLATFAYLADVSSYPNIEAWALANGWWGVSWKTKNFNDCVFGSLKQLMPMTFTRSTVSLHWNIQACSWNINQKGNTRRFSRRITRSFRPFESKV